MKPLLTLLLILLISGCINTGRYSHRNDSAPTRIPSELELKSAEPTFVEHAPANSRPYVVFGKQYFPMESAKGYEATGEASWYGRKFHGHLTANGEVYNMYDMTAAHRTLPLPSFVRVTNLKNNLSTIVRVNDRGPFHDDRLIDLSWAAAKKLDVLKGGTAQVKLEVIHVDKEGLVTIGRGAAAEPDEEVSEALIANSTKVAAEPNAEPEKVTAITEKSRFIQVATLSDSTRVDELAKGLSFLFHLPTHTPKTNAGFQIRLGPIQEGVDIQVILNELRNKGFGDAFEVMASL